MKERDMHVVLHIFACIIPVLASQLYGEWRFHLT